VDIVSTAGRIRIGRAATIASANEATASLGARTTSDGTVRVISFVRQHQSLKFSNEGK
jgi:hypothetical protein